MLDNQAAKVAGSILSSCVGKLKHCGISNPFHCLPFPLSPLSHRRRVMTRAMSSSDVDDCVIFGGKYYIMSRTSQNMSLTTGRQEGRGHLLSLYFLPG